MSSLPTEYSLAPQTVTLGRDPYRDRRPPYSEDAEQAVLSAMLIDQDAVLRAVEHVDDTMFYAERPRRIFRAMVTIAERGGVVDPLTLSDELGRKGELDAAGGKDYIGFLVDAVPTAANIEYHAQIVREKAGKTITGVASGFGDLDEMTSGFQPADLIIVAARPSMGKTAFTLNIAQHAAIETNVPVAFFSLEMSKESLVQRMLTSEARIDAQRLRKGMLRDDDFPRLARAAGILSSAPVWIDDTPGITILEMRSKARRLKSDAGVGMVIVDYLQLMQGPAGSENRQQE